MLRPCPIDVVRSCVNDSANCCTAVLPDGLAKGRIASDRAGATVSLGLGAITFSTVWYALKYPRRPLRIAPNAAMAAMGPLKRFSCPQGFVHRPEEGVAFDSGRDESSGSAESVIS